VNPRCRWAPPCRPEVHRGSRPRRPRGRGFTYLGVMFLVALLGLTAAMASVVWSTEQQRADERELVFAGRQFQAAIERYQQRPVSPNNPAEAIARYPRQLEDLLRDNRAVQAERHLRRIYIDPMTRRPEWGLIRAADGGIVGVHSLSERKPMAGTLLAATFVLDPTARAAATYRDWRFVAPSAGLPASAPAPATEPAPAPAPGTRVPP
jgi:type II secretory pathway pseudopilin PulG